MAAKPYRINIGGKEVFRGGGNAAWNTPINGNNNTAKNNNNAANKQARTAATQAAFRKSLTQ